jgi:hypothetical protein
MIRTAKDSYYITRKEKRGETNKSTTRGSYELNCHIVQLLFILASWHSLLLNCVPMIGVSAAI